MKYFEVFDLEPRFDIDSLQLKRKYLLKSREVHPDFHTLASEDEKAVMLEQSSLLNQAYETLKDARTRKKYLLAEKGYLGENKGDMPQDFLMEMMEFNEKLMELEMGEDQSGVSELKQSAEEKLNSLEEESQLIEKRYDESGDEELLETIKTIYLKQQYLHRILGNLSIM